MQSGRLDTTFVHAGVPYVAHPSRPMKIGPSIAQTYPTTSALVFEGDQANNLVGIYKLSRLTHNPAPIATIAVLCPYGMTMDKAGTLYVPSNCGGNTVTEYAIGQTTPSLTITNGISNPLGTAIDRNQKLYVSNYPASITEYPLGATSPSKTITGGGMTDPFGLALDKSGDLFIADFGASQVFEIKAHTSTPVPLNLLDLTEPLGVAFDNAGNMWVTDGSGDKVNVYPPGSTTPSQSITSGYTFPYAISIDPRGTAVVSNINPPVAVYAYMPGQFTAYATLTNGITLPTGLLVRKP
jgi:serine/threonine-protein kinase